MPDDAGRPIAGPVPVGPGGPGPAASTAGGRSRPRDGDLMSAVGEVPGLPALADANDVALLSLVDRLASILERGDLAELEVGAGRTTIIVRSPAAVERAATTPASAPAADGTVPGQAAGAPAPAPAPAPSRPAVNAPLTGIFYSAPSPGATPYVSVGDYVSVGQIIGGKVYHHADCSSRLRVEGRMLRCCQCGGTIYREPVSPLLGQ